MKPCTFWHPIPTVIPVHFAPLHHCIHKAFHIHPQDVPGKLIMPCLPYPMATQTSFIMHRQSLSDAIISVSHGLTSVTNTSSKPSTTHCLMIFQALYMTPLCTCSTTTLYPSLYSKTLGTTFTQHSLSASNPISTASPTLQNQSLLHLSALHTSSLLNPELNMSHLYSIPTLHRSVLYYIQDLCTSFLLAPQSSSLPISIVSQSFTSHFNIIHGSRYNKSLLNI